MENAVGVGERGERQRQQRENNIRRSRKIRMPRRARLARYHTIEHSSGSKISRRRPCQLNQPAA